MEQMEEKMVTDFGWALDCLKTGKKVQRQGWNGKGLWIELQLPDANAKMTLPIYLSIIQMMQKIPQEQKSLGLPLKRIYWPKIG